MRILFVSSRSPKPVRKGDQARMLGWMEALSSDHDIRFIAPGAPGDSELTAGRSDHAPLNEYSFGQRLRQSHHLVRFPIQVMLCVHRPLEALVKSTLATWKPDVVVLMLSRMGWLLPSLERVPVVVDFVDSLALNMSMRGKRQKLLRWLWNWEAKRVREWELALLSKVRWGFVVSQRDRTYLLGRASTTRPLEVLPFGLDLEAAEPREIPSRPVLMTSGNLGYYPTADGIAWFHRSVWPSLKRRVPRLVWRLAGSRPPRSMVELARADSRIELLPSPPSMTQLLRQATVAVVPLLSGSGVPIKILEAMANFVPVVCTEHAAAGLDNLEGAVVQSSDDPQELIELIATLVSRPEEATSQAEMAHRWLRKHHSLASSARRFEEVLELVAERPENSTSDVRAGVVGN